MSGFGAVLRLTKHRWLLELVEAAVDPVRELLHILWLAVVMDMLAEPFGWTQLPGVRAAIPGVPFEPVG